MIKYVDTKVVFQEYPDEITLAINISNCPYHCPECHSSYLAEDIGTELTNEEVDKLIANNIIKEVQSMFDTKKYITIKFQ